MIDEKPIHQVAEMWQMSAGRIQALQNQAATYAGMVCC
jgi:hypothetical protein